MWVEIIVPSLPFSPGDPVIRISALHKKIPKIPARYSAWNWVHVVFGCTMGLFWEGKRILHWLLLGEVTGVAKGLSLSLAIFTLSYPLFNTPLKNPFFAPLYAYLRTSISTCDFHQIVSFSVEIFACQELFCVVTLPAELSATTMTTETRK